MNQEKSNKKKILTYYIILGVCLLLIAAVTLTVIFATQGGEQPVIDNGGGDVIEQPDDDEDNDDEEDVSSAYEFIAPVEQLDVTCDYTFCYNQTLDCYRFHSGLDMSAAAGTNVLACIDGTVKSITVGDVLDGTKIVLSHADGVETTYMFIDAAEGLKTGDEVKRGDVIGTVAEPVGSEYKDGAHLHFEVSKNGEVVDPNDYLDIAEK